MGVIPRLRRSSPEVRGKVKSLSKLQAAKSLPKTYRWKKGNTLKAAKEVTLETLKGVNTVGSGSFGSVLLVKHEKTNEAFALKIQSKEFLFKRKAMHIIENEVSILKQLQHPLLNKLYKTFEDDRNIYMLLEYVPGGDMFSFLGKYAAVLSNDAHVFYTACILSSLEALHAKDIIYRDLKPENILIDMQGYTRLVDFGFAKRVRGRTYTQCGTPDYFSPELISKKGYGKGNDVWGLGIFVYEMMVAENPFTSAEKTVLGSFRAIIRKPLRFHRYITDEKAKLFLSSVLDKNVSTRGGCGNDGIGALKKHLWLSGVNWADLNAKRVKAPWIPELKDKFDSNNFDLYDTPKNLPANLHGQ